MSNVEWQPEAAPVVAPADGADVTETIPGVVDELRARAEEVIVGQGDNVELLLLALLCGGHVLLEGVPGTAKTLMARTLAHLVQIDCKRVQFTPDLMPSDVVGTNVFNFQTSKFDFRPGPVFTDILVADEINRAPPKTQSALLEVMQERTVTIDGVSHPLSPLFTVVATQNPVEYEGTYRLPEAQLDRFLLKLEVSYPNPEDEDRVLHLYHGRSGLGHPLEYGGLRPVLTRAQMEQVRAATGQVLAKPEICSYVGKIVRLTREMDKVLLGCSPRAAVHLLQASKVMALMSGRNFIIPDDVKRVCRPVLRHRLTLQPDAYLEGFRPDDILDSVLEQVEVPR
jgi:MoxR-like ATPase